MRFSVAKYIPDGLYGFLVDDEGRRAFFHLSEFNPTGGPPPMIGESVEVESLEPNGDKSPRARGVIRVSSPELLEGVVARFDPNVGYGFVSVGARQFFLHRSEVPDGQLPFVGMRVVFYAVASEGSSGKVPRACYVQVMDRGGK